MFKRKPKSASAPKASKAKKEKPKKVKEKRIPKASPMVGSLAIKKPATDVYTIMLIVSLLAILIACIVLWLELSTYGSYPWWKAA